MAGLPLKSGADFYNLEAARMRLHNLGADPTEVGAGLIYFNTSTGLNTSQKARLYTGSAWKTIAFSEDLDVASNADFLALKNKVDTLIGDGVDMDGIIESWKEVEAFLSGMSDTKSLMDLLNGKLNTSGGTINGNLLIGAPDNTSYRYLQFARSGYGSRINVADGDLYVSFGGIDANGGLTATKVFSLGNNGIRYASDGKTYHDILTSAGGTIEGTTSIPLYIKSGHATEAAIGFSANNTKGYGYLIYKGGDVWNVTKEQWAAEYTLLHSGNVGDYKAGGIVSITTPETDNFVTYVESYGNGISVIENSSGTSVGDIGRYDTVLNIGSLKGHYGRFIFTAQSDCKLYFQTVDDMMTGWSAKKTIAFTDSDITGTANKAKALVSSDGKSVAYVADNNTFYIGDSIYPTTSTQILGKDIILRYGANASNGLILNSSGNVTIGNGDLATSGGAKLFVDGDIYTRGGSIYRVENSNIAYYGPAQKGIGANYDGALMYAYDSKPLYFYTGGIRMTINGVGNVGIGTTDPKTELDVAGAVSVRNELFIRNASYSTIIGEGSFLIRYYNGKLQFSTRTADGALKSYPLVINYDTNEATINGDLHVTGNIIADGEVSAGGAAEEGGNAGGGGAFHSESIAVGATQTTIAHGLGTDDIVVSIYEKDGVSGRWSIILTDVEIVDANNIIVSFGSATTVEHKVVIMGAVA